MIKYIQGRFKASNLDKYRGDKNNIIFRSSWELKVFKYLDGNPAVIWWAAEEMSVPYVSPVDNRTHRYFPDIVMRTKKKDGSETTYMLEIKPHSQTIMPVQGRKTKRFLAEVETYVINQSKFRSADLFCQEQGWQFQIITEKDLAITYK